MSLARQFLSKNKNATIVFKAILNNTNFDGRGFEDWLGGPIPNGLLNRDAQFTSNAETLLSNQHVLNGGGVRDAMLTGIRTTKSIGAPLDTENIFEVGDVRLAYRNDESSAFNLQFREFEGASFEILVGGLSDSGRIGERELLFSEYLFFLSGKIPNHTYDHEEIFLALNTIPNELENQWPLETYSGSGGITNGDDQNNGKPKPFCIGRPKNITPVDLTDGLYQFHSGESAVSVDQAFNNGVELTLAAGDPLSESADIGTYKANSDGFVRAHVDVENLTLNVTGISGPANDALIELVRLGTKGRVTVTADAGDFPISYYFTEQRPLIDYVREIAYSLDFYIIHQDDGNIELKRRYNGQPNDFNGNQNIIDSFDITSGDIIEDSIEFLGVSERYSTYRIGYDKNWTVLDRDILPNNKKRELSREYLYVQQRSTLPLSDGIKEKTRIVETNLDNVADAELFSSLIFRDSRKRKRFSFSLINNRWSLEVGSVGRVAHPIIGNGLFEISSVSDDTSGTETQILGYLL